MKIQYRGYTIEITANRDDREWMANASIKQAAGNSVLVCYKPRSEGRIQEMRRENSAGVRAGRACAGETGRRAAVQRREIFAGRCRLCAVPSALFLPRPHPADRPDRPIPAADGLGRHADEAAFDTLVPRGRIRGALPAERQAPEKMAVAVRRGSGGGGGVGSGQICIWISDSPRSRLLSRPSWRDPPSTAPRMKWTLANAWPSQISGVDMKATGNEVAVHTIELAFEILQVNVA